MGNSTGYSLNNYRLIFGGTSPILSIGGLKKSKIMIEKDLGIRCQACAKSCPKKAIGMRPDRVIEDYDKMACLEMAEELTTKRCYPCGICTKVCPIGQDRTLYRQKGGMKKYLREEGALAENPDDPEYKSWTHLRRYGVYWGKRTSSDKEWGNIRGERSGRRSCEARGILQPFSCFPGAEAGDFADF
jgi:Pyruvate/2-oxoacid:ferredoxin oxidoreductase delta subunit